MILSREIIQEKSLVQFKDQYNPWATLLHRPMASHLNKAEVDQISIILWQ